MAMASHDPIAWQVNMHVLEGLINPVVADAEFCLLGSLRENPGRTIRYFRALKSADRRF